MGVRLGIVSVVLASALTAAQSPPGAVQGRSGGDAGQTVTETKHLTLTASAGAKAVSSTGRVSLFLDVEPRPKMHVYAPDQKEYIPIALTLVPNPAYRAEPVRFPPSESYFFAPLKETQRVYSKRFRLEQPVVLAAAGAVKEVAISGTVRYQACDDAICYVPQNVPVSWTIPIKR
jgi:hypothetical protein